MAESRAWRGAVLSAVIVGVALLILAVAAAAPLESSKVDLSEFTRDSQKWSQDGDKMIMVWWIAEEFWKVSAAKNPNTTEAQAGEFVKAVHPYTLVVVLDAKIGPFGAPTYAPEEEIRSRVQLKDADGTLYRPIAEEELGGDVKNLMAMMKPIFVNMIGPMGSNMHFFAFPAETKNARRIVEATQDGKFSVLLGEGEFKWRTPLDALVSPKTCPKCKENMSGAFKFCPWDGTKLPEAKP